MDNGWETETTEEGQVRGMNKVKIFLAVWVICLIGMAVVSIWL